MSEHEKKSHGDGAAAGAQSTANPPQVAMSAPWAKAPAPSSAAGMVTAAPWAARAQQVAESGAAAVSLFGPPSTFDRSGWELLSRKGPILSTGLADKWTKDLSMTLPEMVFGETELVLKNPALDIIFSFRAFDALAACSREADIKVSMSEKWMKKAGKEIPEAQQFDWTYSTKYQGTSRKLSQDAPYDPAPTEETIDFESLKPRDGESILWSSDLILFEDELHDHGTCKLSVRVRATQSYFYVLQRLWVRVDDVVFRLRETRLHHRFGAAHALRQYSEREAPYAEVVQACSPKQLRDGVLDDPDRLAPLLPLVLDHTHKFHFHAPAHATPPV